MTSPQRVINEEELLDRLDGDRELLTELACLFVEEIPSMLNPIRAAVRDQNAAQLKRAAHALKGAVGNLSAYPTYRAALKLEIIGSENKFEEAEGALFALEVEINLLEAALRVYYEE